MTKTQEKLNNHKGRFTSLIFKDGKKTISYCAKIIKITDKTIQFRCQTSGEVIVKMLSSLAE